MTIIKANTHTVQITIDKETGRGDIFMKTIDGKMLKHMPDMSATYINMFINKINSIGWIEVEEADYCDVEVKFFSGKNKEYQEEKMELTATYDIYEQPAYSEGAPLDYIRQAAEKAWNNQGQSKRIQAGWYFIRVNNTLYEIEKIGEFWYVKDSAKRGADNVYPTYKYAVEAVKRI